MRIGMLIALLCALAWGEGKVRNVVFDLTGGDLEKFKTRVLSGIAKNKVHYENSFDELNVAVVIHGDAYKFFVKALSATKYKDDKTLVAEAPELAKRIESMRENYGVEFLMCRAGMNGHGLAEENIHDAVTLVPTSTIGLIDKQSEGYVYVPMR